MNNPLKEHSGKIAVFVINSLLITAGVLAIKNKDETKKSEISTLTLAEQAANESPTFPYLPALKIASENIVADTNSVQTLTAANKNISKSSGSIVSKAAKASGTATAPKTTTAKATSTSAAKTTTVVTPAPKPAPAPAPAKTTKTS
jgi:hypothetical protein